MAKIVAIIYLRNQAPTCQHETDRAASFRVASRTLQSFPTGPQSRSLLGATHESRPHLVSARSGASLCTSVPLRASQIGPVRAWSRIIYVPYIPRIIFVAREAKGDTRCIHAQENHPGYRDDVAGRFRAFHRSCQPDLAALDYDALQHRPCAGPDRCGIRLAHKAREEKSQEARGPLAPAGGVQ